MANKQITDFPLVDDTQPTDIAHLSRAGQDKGIAVADLVPAVGESLNVVVYTFESGSDFTNGFSNTLALPQSVVSKDNVYVLFDGIYQEKDTYTLSAGIVLTFDEPFAVGIQSIEVIVPLSLGVATVEANNILFKDGVTYAWPLQDGVDGSALTTNGSEELSFTAVDNLPRVGFEPVGNGFSSNAGTDPTMCSLTSNRIVSQQGSNIAVYDFDGTNWSQVGNTFSTSLNFADMARISATDFAVVNDDTLYRYNFDGTDITLVGNSLAIPATGTRPTVDSLVASTPTVLVASPSPDTIKAYTHDGTDWTEQDSFAAAGLIAPTSTTLSDNTFVVKSQGNFTFDFYRYSGGSISLVDSVTTTLPVSGVDSMAAINKTDFFHATEEGFIYVLRWNEAEGSISQVGPTYNTNSEGRVAITSLWNAEFAYHSDGQDLIQKYTFDYYANAPTVTGSRGGNAALASMLTALSEKDLIINNTTA